jgi:hypothetical protein
VSAPEPCVFCRVGSCSVHHVLRIVPHTHPGARDDEMVEVGCCDQFEDAVRAGLIRRLGLVTTESPGPLFLQLRSTRYQVRYCPFCGSPSGGVWIKP